MNSLMIFGKIYRQKGKRKDAIQKRLNLLVEKTRGNESAQSIKEFLGDLLHSELAEIYGQILEDSNIDVFGNLDFEVADSIDKKRQRIAKMKENRIIIKLNAVSLPKNALKYIVAHEMAHLITKKHGKKFWKVMESIFPAYEEGKSLFVHNEERLKAPLSLN